MGFIHSGGGRIIFIYRIIGFMSL